MHAHEFPVSGKSTVIETAAAVYQLHVLLFIKIYFVNFSADATLLTVLLLKS